MNTHSPPAPTPPAPAYPSPDPNAAGGRPEGPLNQQHYEALRSAKTRRTKIDSAIKVATFNGWSSGIFAAISALFLPLSFDLQGLLITLGLGAVAYHEFKGRKLLRALDPRGPRMLGYNQIGLGAVIVAYCLWSLVTEFAGPGTYAQTIQKYPDLAQVLGSTGGLIRTMTLLVYGSVIVFTVLYQGFMAWYYFSRGKHLDTYLSQTPGWVTDMERAAA